MSTEDVTDSSFLTHSNVPNETILYYTHELTRSKRRIDEANSAHRLLVKRAKGDGVPTAAVLESIADARLEPEVRRQKIIDRIRIEAARYPDQGVMITDLVGKMDTRVTDKMRFTDTMFDAEQKGYQAGKFGVPVEDNPYPEGSELAQNWRLYWGQGQAANAAALGENARAPSTRRERPAPRVGAVVPLPGILPPRKRGRPPRANGEGTAVP